MELETQPGLETQAGLETRPGSETRPGHDWRQRFTTHEFWVLLILMLVLLGVWIFVELAEMVHGGQTTAWDQAILLALRNPADRSLPIGPAWLSEMMRDITALGGVAVLTLLVLSVTGYLVLVRRYHLAILVLVACLGAGLVDSVIKLGFNRPRPDLVPHLMVVYQSSFPSGHSMASAATYLTLGALLARVQPRLRLKVYFMAIAIFTMVLVGFSRVYLGVHWPSDVLGGWTAGAVWAMGCWLVGWLLTTYLLRRRAATALPAAAPLAPATGGTVDPVTVDPVTVDPVTADPVTVDPIAADPVTADASTPAR